MTDPKTLNIDPPDLPFDAFILRAQAYLCHGIDEVRFWFTGVDVRITKDTDLETLQRDFEVAQLLGWRRIGPNTEDEYSEDIQRQITAAMKQRDAENALFKEQTGLGLG